MNRKFVSLKQGYPPILKYSYCHWCILFTKQAYLNALTMRCGGREQTKLEGGVIPAQPIGLHIRRSSSTHTAMSSSREGREDSAVRGLQPRIRERYSHLYGPRPGAVRAGE